jgi:hypothetical protein
MTLRLVIKSPGTAPYAAVVTRQHGGKIEPVAVIEPGGEAEVTLWKGADLHISEQAAAEPKQPDSAANS